METSREDVGIAIRSAFLRKGTQQRFSLFVLVVFSVILIYLEKIETKPLNGIRSFVKDVIYRGAAVSSYPSKIFSTSYSFFENHINLYGNYNELIKENEELKDNISKSDFLELENSQLRKLIEEQIESPSNFVSARIMLDKQSPYLNSFVINVGSNKGIKNGMAALDGKNFIGRIVGCRGDCAIAPANAEFPARCPRKQLRVLRSEFLPGPFPEARWSEAFSGWPCPPGKPLPACCSGNFRLGHRAGRGPATAAYYRPWAEPQQQFALPQSQACRRGP